jgi:hypothetical protein
MDISFWNIIGGFLAVIVVVVASMLAAVALGAYFVFRTKTVQLDAPALRVRDKDDGTGGVGTYIDFGDGEPDISEPEQSPAAKRFMEQGGVMSLLRGNKGV